MSFRLRTPIRKEWVGVVYKFQRKDYFDFKLQRFLRKKGLIIAFGLVFASRLDFFR